MREAAVDISRKSHMLYVHADNVDIIGLNLREVIVVFSKIEKESVKVGLAVKLLVSISCPTMRLDQFVNVDKTGRQNDKKVKTLGLGYTLLKD